MVSYPKLPTRQANAGGNSAGIPIRQALTSEGREIAHATHNLTNLEQRIKIADPARNLKLGYSLSYVRGKLVRSVQDIAVGDTAEIRICDGSFISDIKQVL